MNMNISMMVHLFALAAIWILGAAMFSLAGYLIFKGLKGLLRQPPKADPSFFDDSTVARAAIVPDEYLDSIIGGAETRISYEDSDTALSRVDWECLGVSLEKVKPAFESGRFKSPSIQDAYDRDVIVAVPENRVDLDIDGFRYVAWDKSNEVDFDLMIQSMRFNENYKCSKNGTPADHSFSDMIVAYAEKYPKGKYENGMIKVQFKDLTKAEWKPISIPDQAPCIPLPPRDPKTGRFMKREKD